MRIVIIGGGSFIAGCVAHACREADIDWIALRHHQDPTSTILPTDCVINFALHPRYCAEAYDAVHDWDLRAARLAASKGARFTMLSTRRVYAAPVRWNAAESAAATGDETAYGRNKAVSEVAVQEACGGNAAIFRLSNIFGYEYKMESPRHSFLGRLLGTLKQQNKIFFDMHPATKRDFLPVEICAGLLVTAAGRAVSGTFNLGSGIPTACGSLAGWIMDGFGGGELTCEDQPKDEFYLNMEKWRTRFDLPITEEVLRNYCVGLGQRLKCEKS